MSPRTPTPDEKIRVMDNGEQKEIPVEQMVRELAEILFPVYGEVKNYTDSIIDAMRFGIQAAREAVNRYPWNTKYSNNYRKYHGLPMRRKTNRRN